MGGEAGAVEAGTVLGGKYRLVSRLGRGGMGEVWAAVDGGLRRQVAVKIVLAGAGGDPGLAERLEREAQTAGGLQHPGITVVHDIGVHDGCAFFVMELLKGVDFSVLLADNPAGLPVGRVVSLLRQVAEALAYAHREKVVHRDIKPANLMELAGGRVKICDFGIARYCEATAGLTAPGRMIGTPAYMAPEQFEGRLVDGRSDLYSLGCTLFALLTGAPPFVGGMAALMHQHLTVVPPRLTSVRPGVPEWVADLGAWLLAKDPDDRPASADVVVAALARTLRADEPTVVGGTGATRRATGTSVPGWRQAAVLTGHTGEVTSVTFSASGSFLASAGRDKTVRLWDPAAARSADVLAVIRGRHPVTAVALSPDAALLAAVGGDRKARLWDPATGRLVGVLGDGRRAVMTAVAFNLDGSLLATGGGDGKARLWNPRAGHIAAIFDHTSDIRSVAFSPDGSLLATGGGDGRIRLWDLASNRLATTLTCTRFLDTVATIFSPDAPVDPSLGVTSVAFSPDGSFLAAGSGDGKARLWDTATGRLASTVKHSTLLNSVTAILSTNAPPDLPLGITTVAFSPDGALLATGGVDGKARLWHVATGKAAALLTGHAGAIYAIEFDPTRTTVATAGSDNTVRLWNPGPVGG